MPDKINSNGFSTVETAVAVGLLGVTISTSLQMSEYAHKLHSRQMQTLLALHLIENTLETIRANPQNNLNQTLLVNSIFTESLIWTKGAEGYQVLISIDWQSDIGKQKLAVSSYVP